MAEVRENARKSVREVCIKKEEVHELLFAAALKRVTEVPGITGQLRTTTVASDGYGGYIVDVIVDDSPSKRKK